MANGYIGKISAVVTANTSDLSRKLQGAVGDVDKFANRIASSIERSSKSAADSLNNIFTPLQRLQRNIQAGLAGNVFRRDNVEQYIRSVQQAVSISEQLGKPLSSGASQFQKLTLEVQGAFLPALDRAQSAVINLSTTLQQQGSISERSFGQVEGVVNSTTQAIQRLTQAQQLASQSFKGNELQFGNPRLFETLSANARTTQRAAALPASALVDGDIARQIRALEQYQNAAVEAAARVESLRLEPNVRPEVLIAAERRLESIVETANRARQAVEGSIEAANRAATAPQRTADNEVALLQRREQAAKQLQDQQNAQAQRVADNEIALLQRREQGAKQAQDRQNALAQRAADNEIALLQRREQAAKQIEDERAARAQRAADNEIALIIRREQAARDAETRRLESAPVALGDRLAEQGRRRVQGLTGNVNLDAGDILGGQAQRDIDALGSRVGTVRQQLESLPNSIRTQFIPALQQAQQQLIALQNSPGATADQIERAAASVKRLEDGANRAASAMSLPSFSEFSENFSTQRAIGELQALQQVLAGIGATAGGPAARAYENYRARLQEAIRTGTTGLPRVRAELEKLQAAAAQAAAATGKISFNAAFRAIQRGGDIARGSFGNLNLAVQQGIFAIDDFTSVTGGLDQRIRAAANNISQLAFIVGGTYGLAIGVAISVTAQLAVGIAKWAAGTEEAEKKQKQLEAAIKQVNSALERQLELTKELTQAYRSIADAIGQASTSEDGQVVRNRRRELEDIRKQQQERRREVAASANPAVGAARARVAGLEEQLQTETDFGARRQIEFEIRQLKARIDSDLERAELGAQAEIDDANRRNPGSPELARGRIVDRRAGAQARLDGLFRQLQTPGLDPQTVRLLESRIAKLSEELATLEVALVKLSDEAGNALFGDARQISDQLARAQADAAGVGGPSLIEAQLNEAARRLEQALEQASSTDASDVAEAAGVVASLKTLTDELSRSAIVVNEFADAIQRSAGDLARLVEQELGSRGESIRRQTNESEARFGAGDDRTEVLRNAQDRIAAARQQAQEQRRQIEDSIRRRQNDLEQDLRAGTGDARAVDLARRAQLAEAQAADQTLEPLVRAQAQAAAASLREQIQSLFESDPEIAGLRDRADQVDVQAQREQQQIEQAIRGRELSLTPGQRAGEALTNDIDAIRQFYGQLAEATTGLVDFGAQNAAIGRLFEQTARGVAPAIFALQDAVANAVLQGPSRAALEATDVSTVEGARELNRLLRGDDGARNQDLVELQKQSAALEELVDLARQQGVPGVAN